TDTTGLPLPGVSILVKNTIDGTTTDAAGKFALTLKRVPVHLVFSFVGYQTNELPVTGTGDISLQLKEQTVPGQEVVVSASKISERLLQSPVTIEKLNTLRLQAAPAEDFYQSLGNLKGVDMVRSSMNYVVFNARGFNSTGNSRLVQLMDGMDMQLPSLNHPGSNLFGPSELDIESMEFVPGTSSALYGPNAFNGVILQTTKNPFRYRGASAFVKYGFNNITDASLNSGPRGKIGPGSPQSLYEAGVRYALAFNNRWAFKITASHAQGKDWYGTNFNDRQAAVKPTGFSFNPGADLIFGAGDEVSAPLGLVGLQLAANPAFQSSPLAPLLKFLPDHIVSRTPYEEFRFTDHDIRNSKLSTSLFYRISDQLELSYLFNYGVATTILNAAQRTPATNLKLQQHKLELKRDNFFVRAYAILPKADEVHSNDLTGVFINNAWKPHPKWFQDYSVGYLSYLAAHRGDQGFDPASVAMQEAAHQTARSAADQGRLLPGTTAFADTRARIISSVIPQGSAIRDNTSLYHTEAQYDFSKLISWISLQAGGSYRLYDLNSNGTLFADSAGNNITVRETGAYLQASKTLFKNMVKLSGSVRFDKNENFDAQFSPRFAAVYSPVETHNFRVAYQTGFRNPTLQGQHNDFNAVSVRLLGGLPQYARAHKAYENAYLLSSVQQFTSAVIKEGTLNAIGKPENLELLKPVQSFAPVRPEKVRSAEIGYKGLLGKKLLFDVVYYYNTYNHFIAQRSLRKSATPIDLTATTVTQANIIAGQSLLSAVATPGNENTFAIYTNVDKQISAQGFAAGIEYNLPHHFTVGGNYNWNQLNEELGDGFLSEYNTPTHKFNITVGNRKVSEHIGFNLVYRWQSRFLWESNFAKGEVPAYGVMDAQVSYSLKKMHSRLRLGGSDIFNKRYVPNIGGPTIGAVYYVSVTFEELMK
ncbi:MAG TPA: TonB-dependent receptor, partial [Chitinophagaceae bacterium]|nr:TonB-dependent receptor [Chitinophagaceae bacterium]